MRKRRFHPQQITLSLPVPLLLRLLFRHPTLFEALSDPRSLSPFGPPSPPSQLAMPPLNAATLLPSTNSFFPLRRRPHSLAPRPLGQSTRTQLLPSMPQPLPPSLSTLENAAASASRPPHRTTAWRKSHGKCRRRRRYPFHHKGVPLNSRPLLLSISTNLAPLPRLFCPPNRHSPLRPTLLNLSHHRRQAALRALLPPRRPTRAIRSWMPNSTNTTTLVRVLQVPLYLLPPPSPLLSLLTTLLGLLPRRSSKNTRRTVDERPLMRRSGRRGGAFVEGRRGD
jgi:hypothetical protein